MADITELKNMVRLGIVQNVNPDNMTARDKTSATQLEFDTNNELTKKSHSHAAYITEWVPNINDMVLCIMQPDGGGDGYIIWEV